MKIKNYVIVLLIITILTIIFLLKNPLQYKESIQPFCGNNVCEENEKDYCLDCNLSCKSEFCNSRINIICENCNTNEELLQELLNNQNVIYNCLSNYYGYNPSRLIYHTIKNTSKIKETCKEKDGCYVKGGNFGEREGIIQEQIPGLINFGNTSVVNKENVGFEIHELAHAFSYYGLGRIPQWFNEGISIYSESKLDCDKKQYKKDEIKENYELYNNQNIVIPSEEYERTKSSNHVIGSLYFGYLEEKYGCKEECVSKIIYKLYEYRQNYTKNDLRTEVINNSLIKEKSEEIIKKDLGELFKLLEIDY